MGARRGPSASCCGGSGGAVRQVWRPRRRVLRARGDRGHRPHLRREGGRAERGAARGSAFTPNKGAAPRGRRGKEPGLASPGPGRAGGSGWRGGGSCRVSGRVSEPLCVCLCVRVAVRG